MSTNFRPREVWDGEALHACQKCGALVDDMPLHHIWHEKLVERRLSIPDEMVPPRPRSVYDELA